MIRGTRWGLGVERAMVERGVWGLAARTEVEMADGSRVEVVQRVGQTGWDAVGIALGGDKSGRVSRQARDELMSQLVPTWDVVALRVWFSRSKYGSNCLTMRVGQSPLEAALMAVEDNYISRGEVPSLAQTFYDRRLPLPSLGSTLVELDVELGDGTTSTVEWHPGKTGREAAEAFLSGLESASVSGPSLKAIVDNLADARWRSVGAPTVTEQIVSQLHLYPTGVGAEFRGSREDVEERLAARRWRTDLGAEVARVEVELPPDGTTATAVWREGQTAREAAGAFLEGLGTWHHGHKHGDLWHLRDDVTERLEAEGSSRDEACAVAPGSSACRGGEAPQGVWGGSGSRNVFFSGGCRSSSASSAEFWARNLFPEFWPVEWPAFAASEDDILLIDWKCGYMSNFPGKVLYIDGENGGNYGWNYAIDHPRLYYFGPSPSPFPPLLDGIAGSPQLSGNLGLRREVMQRRVDKRAPGFLVYINSHCVTYRERAFDALVDLALQRGFDAPIAAGRCHGSHPETSRWKNDRGTDTVHTLADYRFALVMENSVVDNYITEKLPNAVRAGVVPIYYGTRDVFKIFNADAFVFYDVDDPRPALDRIAYLESDPAAYAEMLAQPILANGDRTLEEYFVLPHDVGTGGGLRRRIREMVLGQDVF